MGHIGPTPSQSNICIDYKMKYQIEGTHIKTYHYMYTHIIQFHMFYLL